MRKGEHCNVLDVSLLRNSYSCKNVYTCSLRYETKISNSRYDFPHLRIPVIIFIIPLFCNDINSAKYLLRSIICLLETYVLL